MTLVDTPDYQRGIVNAQKLLATVDGATATVDVSLPPNCESLILVAEQGMNPANPSCFGTTTVIQYPAGKLRTYLDGHNLSLFVFDVSDVIDAAVTIGWSSAPGVAWFVYSDAGVHGITDMSNRRDANGSLFTVPTIPYGEPGSHPPQELSWGHFTPSATQNILAAPGAGQRYRIFAASMASAAVGLLGLLYDTTTGQGFFTSAGAGSNSLHLPPQGVPISVNGPLGYAVVGGSGAMVVAVLYTTEFV